MRCLLLVALLTLAACGQPRPPAGFAASGPAFDPVAFFTGHVTSWGVEEDRAGRPIDVITTDCRGILVGPEALRMTQVLRLGGAPPRTRLWQLRRTGPSTYVATANDMAGRAVATVSGRTLHWRWVLRARPGNPLANVTMEQWMYRMDDGAVVIRTTVSKLGVRLVEVTEQFEKQQG